MTTGGINRREAIGAIGATAAFASAPGNATPARGGIAAAYLRTEWRVDPIGIDTLRPRFSWELAAPPGARAIGLPAVRLLVASSPRWLAEGRGDVWDSGPIAGASAPLAPTADLRLVSHRRYWWTVEIVGVGRARPATFVTGLIDSGEWRGRWLAAAPDPTLAPHVRGWAREQAAGDTPLPRFRRDISVRPGLAAAIVSVSGLGHYVLRINGNDVTETLLNPGWTDYRKTILYNSYDVTRQLRPGANALGMLLGNGFFNVEQVPGRYTKLADSFGAPKFILQLSLHYRDGTSDEIVSDESWRWAPGPIAFSSIYGGEDGDGRRAQPGWDRPGFDARGWSAPLAASPPGGRLQAQGVVPVAVDRRLKPASLHEPKPGILVYDFGLNASARPALVVEGARGSRIRLLPSEILHADGTIWPRSIGVRENRGIWFNYTLSGGGAETFVPAFTYLGFRYLQVERHPAEAGGALPHIVSLDSEFVHADMAPAGTFASGNVLMTQVHRLIEQAALSNAVSVLTDCPHREKLGWLEQTHLNSDTILFNRDAITIYEKMVGDIADAQQPDGMVPGIAPEYVAFLEKDGSDAIWRNSPEWGGAAVLAPWAAWRLYGDRRLLDRAWPAAVRYADYLEKSSDGLIVDFGMGDWDDVGPKKGGPSQLTSRALTGTGTFYQCLVALAGWARMSGRPAEAERYVARAAAVRDAFNRRFLKGDRYESGSQTANAMPLALGLVPKDREAAVLADLVAGIRGNGNGITAGDVGFHYVVKALSRADRDDVLFDMISVRDRPGYAWQLAHGATSLIESWKADPQSSQNHFMMGHAEGWLYRRLAGIDVDFDRPADRVITIAPRPVAGVPSARATWRSVLGPIASAWRREGAALEMEVTIPAGAVATVRVPTTRPGEVTESGTAAAKARGVRSARVADGALELVLGSGDYRLIAAT
jgi:hypothetical protein